MTEHEIVHIPWTKLIIPQLVNFTIVIGLLIHFLKKPLAAHFSGKSEEFEAARRAADQAKLDAEKQNQEVRAQLKTLEQNADQNIAQATADAKELKAKLIKEAQTQAAKIEEEANRMTSFELQRAMVLLRQELINNSTQWAETNLRKTVDDSTQERLQKEFFDKMQGART